jgi:hypothetical protein
LWVSSTLATRSSVSHPIAPVPPASPLVASSIAHGVKKAFATERRKFRRLRPTVLHRVLVVLVLEDLRGVLLVQRHMRCSCYLMTLWPLRHQELLVL